MNLTALASALYSLFLDKGQYASEWGLSASINAFIMGFAAIIGSIIVTYFGFPILFLSMIIMSLISTSLALKYKDMLTGK